MFAGMGVAEFGFQFTVITGEPAGSEADLVGLKLVPAAPAIFRLAMGESNRQGVAGL